MGDGDGGDCFGSVRGGDGRTRNMGGGKRRTGVIIALQYKNSTLDIPIRNEMSIS